MGGGDAALPPNAVSDGKDHGDTHTHHCLTKPGSVSDDAEGQGGEAKGRAKRGWGGGGWRPSAPRDSFLNPTETFFKSLMCQRTQAGREGTA